MRSLWKSIRHNHALVFGSALSLAVVVWVYGCQTTAVSILNPPAKVTRAELHVEVDTYLALAKLRFEDMDRTDNLKSTIFTAVLNYAGGGAVNPVAVALVIGNILGIGAVVDNRRKDSVIKTLKSKEVT